MKNIIQTSILAGIMGLCYACSGNESELNEVTSEIQISRGADVEATAALETAGTLETILKEAHGDDVANITKLTITGNYNATDHGFLLTLKDLHTLDLKGATITGSESLTYTNANGYERYLSDNTVSSYMFMGLNALKSLVLPDNLQTINGEGFREASLESIEIPSSVTSLGDYAFADCEELVEVKIKAELTTIPELCFFRCYKLTKIELSNTIETVKYGAFSECSLDDFTPFQNVTTIEGMAFEGCNFKELKLTDKITQLGNSVFQENKDLTTVEFLCNLTAIPEDTFHGCTSLNSITLATSVVSVGARAFYECSSLTSYDPFANVKEIGYYAFHACGFTELNLPEGVTKLEGAAFSNLLISTLTLPSTLIEIQGSVFNSCKNLTTITVPESVTTVGGSFIDNCTGLTAVFWNSSADIPGINTYSKDYDITPNILLYVSNENIKVDDSWKNLIINGVANRITLTEERLFHCPQEFTAKKISYTRNFNLQTSIGGNEGWETIVLPFAPTAYEHKDKGVIAPFDSEIDTKKHFWLRGLTADGFTDVTTMEAGKPYIISMPNSYSYVDEYNLNGDVTFSAENVTIPVTPDPLESVSGPGFALQPVYKMKETSISIYSLNEYYIDSYPSGSVFAHSQDRAVQPFEAYAFIIDGKSARHARVINVSKKTTNSRAASMNHTTGIPQKEDMN